MSPNPRIRDWAGLRVWIIGASSGIGAATANALLARGARVALSARREPALADIATRHPDTALIVAFDATVASAWRPALDRVLATWGGIDLAIFLAADYRPVRAWQLDAAVAESMVRSNVVSVTHGLSVLVPQLCRQGAGGIALTASLAGYGGLPHALIYGATKAALINMAETLYLDLHPRNISVHVINPGFVRTPLTERNDFHMPGLLEPEQAARCILRGLERGRFDIAFPRRLAWPLKALRFLPRRFYFPLIHRITGT